MPGLDKKIIDLIDPIKVIDRVKIDVRTDFILAPHYNAIFINAGAELWARVYELLRSGQYQPGHSDIQRRHEQHGRRHSGG